MVERINKILSYYNLTSSQFANEIGVQRSAMSHILSGRNNPSLDFILKILNRFPEISTDWLLMGTGEMINNTNKDKQDDLFSNDDDSYSKENRLESEQPQEYLVKNKDIEENNAESLNKKSPESHETEDYTIEKIVFFYSNGKFKEYNP